MATVRTANAHWEGSLLEGSGTVELASSGLATFDVSWPARSEAAKKAAAARTPEERSAAAKKAAATRKRNRANANG